MELTDAHRAEIEGVAREIAENMMEAVERGEAVSKTFRADEWPEIEDHRGETISVYAMVASRARKIMSESDRVDWIHYGESSWSGVYFLAAAPNDEMLAEEVWD